MAVSEKQKGYAKKYIDKLDEIKIRSAKGTKDRWRRAADKTGKSLTQFIIDAVEEFIGKING